MTTQAIHHTASVQDLIKLIETSSKLNPAQSIFDTSVPTFEQIDTYTEYIHEFALHLGYINALIDRAMRDGVERIVLSLESAEHITLLTKMKGFIVYK